MENNFQSILNQICIQFPSANADERKQKMKQGVLMPDGKTYQLVGTKRSEIDFPSRSWGEHSDIFTDDHAQISDSNNNPIYRRHYWNIA